MALGTAVVLGKVLVEFCGFAAKLREASTERRSCLLVRELLNVTINLRAHPDDRTDDDEKPHQEQRERLNDPHPASSILVAR
ncbi:hypothetical protein [Terrihabitans rhizophilus]|uniref:hypothetical protein n=1 Tax=Terrihabitans rhizophilus TaxID=3092662 RepID=UPI0029DE7F66|nr:hypothetical protein [Terrihabitans sp. PJ23]